MNDQPPTHWTAIGIAIASETHISTNCTVSLIASAHNPPMLVYAAHTPTATTSPQPLGIPKNSIITIMPPMARIGAEYTKQAMAATTRVRTP
jgi:hypothetical protein